MRTCAEWLLGLLCIAFLLSLSSCEDFGDPPPRINLDPRNPSIEGIHLGDSPGQVQKVLGLPPGTGWLDGIDGGPWRSYQYDYRDRHAFCLMVGFLSNPGGEEWGPVDFVWVKDGYNGKTREGIGTGSSRAIVYRFFGLPQKAGIIDSLGNSNDFYCRGKARVQFQFLRDTVRGISLGPFRPTQFDLVCP